MSDTEDPRDHPALDDLPLFNDTQAAYRMPSVEGPQIKLVTDYPGRNHAQHPPSTHPTQPQANGRAPADATPPAPWRLPAAATRLTGPAPTPQIPPGAGDGPAHVPGLNLIHTPTGPARPAQPAPGSARPYAENIDWAMVNALRAQASAMLTEAISDATLTVQQQRELGRTFILELLDTQAQTDITTGRRLLDPGQQQRMAEAVFDALFGLGRLQPLVDDPDVENIMIVGNEPVVLEDSSGQLRQGPAVAETDEELIDFLAFVASRSEVNARAFSPAHPLLDLRLDGGARLAATAWVTPRPNVVIRRHRLVRISLGDLVQRSMLSPIAASFLAAAVRARKSIVVSGPQGAGKTTLVRALCNEIPSGERIGTFETEYELFLDEIRPPGTVLPFEARPGTGEPGLDGQQAGEISLSKLLQASFRYNLRRQIVGEVRGPEILAMIKAMQSGAGSISTTHAASAMGAIRKLVTCAMEAGPHITESYALRAVAEDINVIVQLHLDTDPGETPGTARRARWVSEIITVHPGENGPAHTVVFGTDEQTPAYARSRVLPDDYRILEQHGFSADAYTREAQSWR